MPYELKVQNSRPGVWLPHRAARGLQDARYCGACCDRAHSESRVKFTREAGERADVQKSGTVHWHTGEWWSRKEL